MYALYKIAIRLYYFLIKVLVPFNRRAAEWYRGRETEGVAKEEEIPQHVPVIWFHASSLGEYEQAAPLIKMWKSKNPDHFILLTFYSPSGFNQQKGNSDVDRVMYLPLDIESEVKRFLDFFHPHKVIIIKNEIWPVLMNELSSRQIPSFLVSALFRKDQLFFKWYGAWYLSVLKMFTYFFVQDASSAKILSEHQINNYTISGDTRIDRVVDQAAKSESVKGINLFANGCRIIVAGSSWPQEESYLKRFFSENSLPGIKLILAPHDVSQNHLRSIEKLFGSILINYTSFLDDPARGRDKKVLLIDRVGLLSKIYKDGHIAVIGGAFGSGLHNLLEPAVYGLPVVFGPRYHKFVEAVELVNSRAGFSVKSYSEFAEILSLLIEDEAIFSNAGKGCSQYVNNSIGATSLIISHLLEKA